MKGSDHMLRRTKSLTTFELELIQHQVDAIRQEFKEDRKESEARLALDRKESEARQQATEARLALERKESIERLERERKEAAERLERERRESIERLERERKDARSTRRWLITNFVAIMVLLISGLITFFTLING